VVGMSGECPIRMGAAKLGCLGSLNSCIRQLGGVNPDLLRGVTEKRDSTQELQKSGWEAMIAA